MITTSHFQIEYCIPQKNKEDEETVRLNVRYNDIKDVERKLKHMRESCPGRRWNIIHIEKREKVHLTIME